MKGIALGAVLCGILGILTSVIPSLGLWPAGMAIFLGLIAFHNQQARELALLAVILGGMGALLAGIWMLKPEAAIKAFLGIP